MSSALPVRMQREEAQALTGLVALFAITAAWWALALWPLPNAPAWLERTRAVCFGVQASGLPDGGGWIGLTAGPLGMLALLVAGWHRGLQSLRLRARHSRVLAGVFATLLLGTLVLITGAAARVQQAGSAVAWVDAEASLPPASYPRLDRVAPPLVLSAHTGATVSLAALRGRPALVTFAYAHCTTVCPVIVTHVLRAQAALQDTRDEPLVLIVTLDPWRDPPSRLPAMARTWNLPAANAWVLSGEVAAVEAVLDAWNVPRTRDPATGEVTHPSLVYVIDRDGRIAFASTGDVDALISLLRRV